MELIHKHRLLLLITVSSYQSYHRRPGKKPGSLERLKATNPKTFGSAVQQCTYNRTFEPQHTPRAFRTVKPFTKELTLA